MSSKDIRKLTSLYGHIFPAETIKALYNIMNDDSKPKNKELTNKEFTNKEIFLNRSNDKNIIRRISKKNKKNNKLHNDRNRFPKLNSKKENNKLIAFSKTKYSKMETCNFNKFVKHIESKFTAGMSWENYGKWEIDHIYPLSLAYMQGKKIFKQACQYTNLQPLWKKDYLSKFVNDTFTINKYRTKITCQTK